MKETLLTGLIVLLLLSGNLLGQSSKRKPKAKPSNADSNKPFDTRCGVHFKSMDEFLDTLSLEEEWVKVSDSHSRTHYYSFKRSVCDDKGIWKIWIKDVEKDSSKPLAYSMTRYWLNCRTNQIRIISATDYNKIGEVLSTWTSSDIQWDDVVPDSVGEQILNTACRKSV